MALQGPPDADLEGRGLDVDGHVQPHLAPVQEAHDVLDPAAGVRCGATIRARGNSLRSDSSSCASDSPSRMQQMPRSVDADEQLAQRRVDDLVADGHPAPAALVGGRRHAELAVGGLVQAAAGGVAGVVHRRGHAGAFAQALAQPQRPVGGGVLPRRHPERPLEQAAQVLGVHAEPARATGRSDVWASGSFSR